MSVKFLRIFLIILSIHLFVLLCCWIFGACGGGSAPEPQAVEKPAVEEKKPEKPNPQVRPFPASFKRKSCMPDKQEAEASGGIVNSAFSPGRDLIYVDDPRVWWESDHDGETDDEDDHSMHTCIEPAFRRLVELVAMSNATLRVQEAYRPQSIHAQKSLHREGRALDLTCPGLDPAINDPGPASKERVLPSPLSLEILAKLCWAAGFDWVYYEVPQKSGAHLHVSCRDDRRKSGE